MKKELLKVSKKEWDMIDSDYKGEWKDYWGDHPEWLGRKCVMSTCVTKNPNESCALLIEGVHFAIV